MADRVLRCTDLVKSYNGVTVLKAASIAVRAGEVVGLIGENGAGKSTLSGIIAGNVKPDSGSMTLDGEPYASRSPAEGLSKGVVLVHQEIRLVPTLSVAENIFIGRLPMLGGRVDFRRMEREARAALELLGLSIDPNRRVAGLSMGVQQEIEIAKALARQPRYVIFDEPSASLGERETDRILRKIDVLRREGVGVIYISHRLKEVCQVAQEIVCLRDGSVVRTWNTGDVRQQDLVAAMVGRDFAFEHHAPQPAVDQIVLEVRNLGRKGVFEGINFSLAKGEILGMAGLVGAGRTEVVRTIAGVDRFDQGEVILEGKPLKLRSPADAIRAGIVMVPEDRKGQGLLLTSSSAENIAHPWERMLWSGGLITKSKVKRLADKSRQEFDIRGSMDGPAGGLSGGNQQKVLLAKWLVKTPKVLILDEPTRGVDVGAKTAIYEIVRQLAAKGLSVIVVSSELEEVLGLSHRIVVMSGGRQRAVLKREEADSESVMHLAVPASEVSA